MEENRVLTESERNWAMLCHLGGFAAYFFPMGGIIGPLIFWLSKKDESAWVDVNGKAAMNFNLSIFLYSILIFPLYFILVGFVLLGMLHMIKVICIIIASVEASKGNRFRYPMSIPFIQ